jgi:hypothetical protein
MTTTYNPKTLLRLYDASGTYLSTAVVLNDGNVLEVKNSDGKNKGQYSCTEAWQETRPDSTLKVDDKNASKIAPIRHKDKLGFIDQDTSVNPKRHMYGNRVFIFNLKMRRVLDSISTHLTN